MLWKELSIMIKIDWKKDYNREFICPKCNEGQLVLKGSNHNKKSFKCSKCERKTINCCDYRKNYFKKRLKAYGFGCPSEICTAKEMMFRGLDRQGKKVFECQVCKSCANESINLIQNVVNRIANKNLTIKPFDFEDDIWDLRAIGESVKKENTKYLLRFNNIQSSWFKILVKKYSFYLIKINKSAETVDARLVTFRCFSKYLVTHDIQNIKQISRDLILDYLSDLKTKKKTISTITRTLINLRGLFDTGNIQGWFQINPDLIRNSDYLKIPTINPAPISDIVREQIEQNLHKLPDPIARMWIICFFAAMRPQELALLKKDCLKQVGDKWNLIWNREKSSDQHSVPISRTIAKVVQEQLEYIEELWGEDWEYLFCHYQNISQSAPSSPKLKPVKKVILKKHSPLKKAIRTLIKSENIRDDNGELAKFQPKLLRTTRLTELFLKGHDLSVVSAWAGHRQLATTANFYTQVTCQQIEKEVGHIQSALVNAEGKKIYYESMPKSFWENPVAHELEVTGTHINTPIYGYCGLDLDAECDKFRACYTCRFFVAKPEKLSQYIKQRDELRTKHRIALANGHGVLVEQFARVADQLDKIILSLQEAV